MPLWGKIDQANNAPKYKILSTSANTGSDLFATQVVGLSDAEVVSGNHAHSGWNRVIRGTGPVLSLTISVAGTGYANTDTVRVSNGTVNAAATITTNGSGAITTVTVTNGGSGFVNTAASVVTITTSAGTGATLVPVLGGRGNRVSTETLVALSSMSGNNSIV